MGDTYWSIARREDALYWYKRAGLSQQQLEEIKRKPLRFVRGSLEGKILINDKTVPDIKVGILTPRYLSLDDILKNMGYEKSIIEKPMLVELFEAVANPSITVLYKVGTADISISFGWYQNDKEHQLIPFVTSPTSPITFNPEKGNFGFYIERERDIYENKDKHKWYTELKKNRGPAPVMTLPIRVKVFPIIAKGEQVADSYLLCWDQMGSEVVNWVGRRVNNYVIVRVDGIRPVTTQPFPTPHSLRSKEVIDANVIDRNVEASTETDSEGTFRLEHLIEGEYRLAIMADEKLLPSDAKKVKVVNAPGRIIINAQNPTVDLGEIKIMVAK